MTDQGKLNRSMAEIDVFISKASDSQLRLAPFLMIEPAFFIQR